MRNNSAADFEIIPRIKNVITLPNDNIAVINSTKFDSDTSGSSSEEDDTWEILVADDSVKDVKKVKSWISWYSK